MSEKTKMNVSMKNSDHNIISQGNTFNSITNNIVLGEDGLNVLKDTENFEAIQSIAKYTMENLEKTHTLFPDFKARYDYSLNKLISSPATEEALKKYPKNIKGEFEIDYSKYPHMSKNETPWEYAYRTQTKVQLKTTKYKEYLGDCEDPYPVMTESDSMMTIIEPPKFPKPIEASISSGNIVVPLKLQRVPCMEYGKTVIESIDENSAIKLRISFYENNREQSQFVLTKIGNNNLEKQLMAENLIASIKKRKNVVIKTGNKLIIDANVNEDSLKTEFFQNAEASAEYISKLLFIEQYFGIEFKQNTGEITEEESIRESSFVNILYASLNNKWLMSKMEFDNRIRCDYDKISINRLDEIQKNEFAQTAYENIEYNLRGHVFSVKEFLIHYKGIRVNNYNSVLKNIERKKKGILITFKPFGDRKTFDVYEKFNNVSIIK